MLQSTFYFSAEDYLAVHYSMDSVLVISIILAMYLAVNQQLWKVNIMDYTMPQGVLVLLVLTLVCANYRDYLKKNKKSEELDY